MDLIVKPSFQDRMRRAYSDISLFVRDIFNEDLHEEQETWLKNSLFKQFGFLRAGNRWGKGDCGMFKGAYLAFYKPVPKKFKEKKVHLLNTSISQDQANIILNKFEDRSKDKKMFSWIIKDIKHIPFPHVIFKNDVIWWFRNASQDGKYLEGRSYYWTNFDEADLQPNLAALVENTIEPRTWDLNGFIDVMTTPRRGHKNSYVLWKKWESLASENKAFLFQGNSLKNKFLPEAALERMKKLPKRLLDQNVYAEWTSEGGAWSDDVIEFAKGISTGILSEPRVGEHYVKGWDLARSSTWCICVIMTYSKPNQIVHVIRFQEASDNRNPEYWQLVEAKIKSVHAQWPGPTVIDYTGVGDVVASYIASINPILIKFTERLKADVITHGTTEFEHGNVGLPFVEHVQPDGTVWSAESECREFQTNTEGLIWDFVCSMFLCLWVIAGKHNANGQKVQPVSLTPSIPLIRGVSKYGSVR